MAENSLVILQRLLYYSAYGNTTLVLLHGRSIEICKFELVKILMEETSMFSELLRAQASTSPSLVAVTTLEVIWMGIPPMDGHNPLHELT